MDLIERVDQEIKNRQEYLGNAMKAKQLLEQLPSDIRALEGTVGIQGGDNELKLTFYYNELDELRAIFREHGIREWGKDFNSYSGQYSHTSKAVINGVDLTIELYGVGKPANCELVETTETIKRYKSVCMEVTS